MHRILSKQLIKTLGEDYQEGKVISSDQINTLIAEIDSTYAYFCKELKMLERTIDVNSTELNEANANLIKRNKEISKLATTDTLTGLPNRLAFCEKVEEVLAQSKGTETNFSVLFIDVDRFKKINDTLGHHHGDIVLMEVSNRLKSCVRKTDLVSRIGGDEFTILLENIPEKNISELIAKKILHEIRKPIKASDNSMYVSVSIGIANYPESGTSMEELIKNSDTTMYQVKSDGRDGYKVYNPDANNEELERMLFEMALGKAIDNNELELYYQPQFCLSTDKIVGAEALLRWNSEVFGFVLPDRIITLAEETGLIYSLGKWVINEACKQCAIWQSKYQKNIRIAVNISSIQFNDDNFVNSLKESISDNEITKDLIELEITESTLMKSDSFGMKTIKEIEKMGFHFAIDDFGTGYSSLSVLKQLPIETIKIDRCFVQEIDTNSNDLAIVSAIIAMAYQLNMRVIAEGIETENQKEILQEIGCTVGQGYYYLKPAPVHKFENIYFTNVL